MVTPEFLGGAKDQPGWCHMVLAKIKLLAYLEQVLRLNEEEWVGEVVRLMRPAVFRRRLAAAAKEQQTGMDDGALLASLLPQKKARTIS